MLKKIVDGELIEARAILGFYPCNSNGDDIEVYDENDGKTLKGTYATLR